jgi:hypothetical protein
MTKTTIIAQFNGRFLVCVEHPESGSWSVSCPSRASAELVALRIESGAYCA